jgi:hypothetical protein
MILGRWPLIGVEEARALAVEALRECRSGRNPAKAKALTLPTLMEALSVYCSDKRLKPTSRSRYDSMIRTHFAPWQDQPVSALAGAAFSEHCHQFAQNTGAALVEVGRGLIGAMIRYLNAVHDLNLENPFQKLAAAGLMPERSKPRARVLREDDLPKWRMAVDSIPEKQRDYLLLLIYTGLRRDEGIGLTRAAVDLDGGIISIPETKNGKPHSLPVTPLMGAILRRRCEGLASNDLLFGGISKEHIHSMAMRKGAPRFMLHDLRKLVATTGERLGQSDAVLRRILNHTPTKSDVLHSHYVQLGCGDIASGLSAIQAELERMMSP